MLIRPIDYFLVGWFTLVVHQIALGARMHCAGERRAPAFRAYPHQGQRVRIHHGCPETLRNLERIICKTVFLGSQRCSETLAFNSALPVWAACKLWRNRIRAPPPWDNSLSP
jgi:hypothetical protein